ncbi:MAG TPA: hypothetical protein VK835_00990 [Bacteroidia bacterium]|nr:hypothetical protein [Bacteroidia bacterium]
MNRKIKITLLILLLMALGFFRENIFVNVNSVLYNKWYNEIHPVVWYVSFLSNFSYKTIYIAKWFITPLFALIYWFAQKQLLLSIFNEKKIIKWLSVLYLSLFLLAGIFFVAGWALGDVYKGYTLSRLFMGLLESPVACMILIPTAYLYKQTNINQQ